MRVELENSRDQAKVLQQQLHRRLEESSVVDSRLSAMKGHEEHIRDLQAQVTPWPVASITAFVHGEGRLAGCCDDCCDDCCRPSACATAC